MDQIESVAASVCGGLNVPLYIERIQNIEKLCCIAAAGGVYIDVQVSKNHQFCQCGPEYRQVVTS